MGGYNVEDIIQIYRDVMGCDPFSFQEPMESMQVNLHEAHPSSFGNVSFNPPYILNGGNKEDILNCNAVNNHNYSVVNSQNNSAAGFNIQFPNGVVGQNRTKETRQGWQRVRWTDEMVMILISVVSYYEGVENDWNHLLSPIKGKWRSISNTLIERGYWVSPQQCEDKFNDLNKKYKRLILILGTDAAYNVMENPSSLMGALNIPNEAKDEVRKILTCKQLFFREMYSYHAKNDKFLPHDVTLQQSMLVTLNDVTSDNGDFLPHQVGTISPEEILTDCTNVLPGVKEQQAGQSEMFVSQSRQLEEKKLQIQLRMLELEKKRFEFMKSCKQEDGELHQMMLDNKMLMIENERMTYMLKCRKRGHASN